MEKEKTAREIIKEKQLNDTLICFICQRERYDINGEAKLNEDERK